MFTGAFATAVDGDIAGRMVEEAALLAGEIDDEALRVLTMLAESAAGRFRGQPELGLGVAEAALERARALDDDELVLSAALNAILCNNAVDPDRAEEIHQEFLGKAERSGNLLLLHDLHTFAGERALELGDLPAARIHLARAAEIGRVFGAATQYAAAPMALVLREEGDGDGAMSMLQNVIRTTLRAGDHRGLAYAVLGTACLAGDRAEWETAARLHGASQEIIDQIGQPWLRYERIRRASIDSVCAKLGAEEFERIYHQGRALSLEQAIELALGEGSDAPRAAPFTPGR